VGSGGHIALEALVLVAGGVGAGDVVTGVAVAGVVGVLVVTAPPEQAT
jgi:hypothetical protein